MNSPNKLEFDYLSHLASTFLYRFLSPILCHLISKFISHLFLSHVLSKLVSQLVFCQVCTVLAFLGENSLWLTLSQIFRSLALTVKDFFLLFFDWEEKEHLVSELIN